MSESEREKDIIRFLENFKSSESLNIFLSLRKDCLGVIDPPIVLEHQILTSEGEKSSLQDLEMLVRDGVLRKLRVPRSIPSVNIKGSTGYCLKEDILRAIKGRLSEGVKVLVQDIECDSECLWNRDTYRKKGISGILDLIKGTFESFQSVNVNYAVLRERISQFIGILRDKFGFCSQHDRFLDQESAVDILIRCGILRRDGSDLNSLVFTTPSMGLFIQYLESGNNALISLLKRSRYKELFEDKFNTIKLGKSQLPLDFHLRDMQGVGLIKRT
ncbi:serine/threonine-protein kinase 19 isoform X2 [Cryptosporidium felis]|nr:serine/threonine-protein kinase 19 isoform X2 [Cryptosporidium felis]